MTGGFANGIRPRRTRSSRWLAPAVGLLLAVAANGFSGSAPPTTVRLIVDYGNSVEKHYNALPWKDGLTVLDALKLAQESKPGIEFRASGGGETALVSGIDGFANRRGGPDGRNWVFRVNDQLAVRSCGVEVLKPGDIVVWKYDLWRD